MVFHLTGKTLFWSLTRNRVVHLRVREPFLLLERIGHLEDTHLLHSFVFLQLVRDISLYRFLILTYCIHIVAPTPKLSVPILELHVCPPLVDNTLLFPLRYPINPLTLIFGGISTSICT